MQSKLKVQIAILIALLLDLPHEFQHFALQLLVEQEVGRSSRGIEESDRAVSRYLA